MPRALILAIGRTAGRPIRFCSSSFCNFSITVLKGIARMLHVKAPVRGLGWVHRGTQARTATLNRVSSSHVHELAPDVEAVIRNIHSNATKAVVYATGGAVQSISWLLAVPGASATVLEAAVPYARDSLVSILGQEPEQFCSAATAAAMAETAYRRAADLSPFGSSVVGLGATCSLATVDVKRGDHRAYVAVHSGGGSRCMALTLAKGARSRVGEDDLVSRLLVKMLADASGADSTPLQLPLISPDATAAAAPSPPTPDPAAVASTNASSTASPRGSAPAAAVSAVQPCDVLHDTWRAAADPVQRLLRGEVRCVEFCGREVTVDAPRRGRGRVYLPGSFNPLHEGHRELLAAAVRASAASCPGGGPVEGAFELTVQNPDKGLLSEDEVRRRVSQFFDLGLPLLITRAPLFTNKADLLPGGRFVVGYDTAARLVMPKYYGNSYTQMLLDFARLRQHGCSFVVAGRKDSSSGAFMSLDDVEMPPELADLFPVVLREGDFRLDISSTELRQRALAQHAQQA